ncbi:hypothetical protein Tsubulata_021399 [Turnera subulata]|uniref:RNA exonuclease 4 n=1 Tax=Turnera subulata TaxID=218843 RepID=A0A9Q0GC66_9ROSI|nr:hypothetical protein Tsubulata_021399 [Turnera subulata]
MGSVGQQQQQKKKNPKKNLPLNPNWAQLQQKLQCHGSNTTRPPVSSSSNLRTEAMDSSVSVLGKRKERSNTDSTDDNSGTNPLTPTNDDFSLTDAVAMDCEMVGVGQGNRSALGRVTLVNSWGNVIYDEFVHPIERVVDFRTQISGIRPRDLRKAKDFATAQRKVAELIKGRILVGHALSNDLKALLLSHPKKDLRDTRERRRKALRHLAAEFLGVKIQSGEHCPVEDARAAMLLYQMHKREWEKNIKDQMRLKQRQKRKWKNKPKESETP